MKNNMEDFFKDKRQDFDGAEPNIGHFERFQGKLNKVEDAPNKKGGTSWYILAVAASVLLVFGYWMGNNNQTTSIDQGIELAAAVLAGGVLSF